MKTNTTEEQIKAIIAALDKMYVRPFNCESSDPKCSAQRCLNGKTHYVDDDTLRFHKSRVLSCRELYRGLLLRIVCSDSMDPEGRKRGFRAVVFDVFGTTVFRPKLEDCFSTKDGALRASEREEIDLLAHYRAALASQISYKQSEIDKVREVAALLSPAQ